jgi:predicted alpha-1,6-mannanase (GH76 family)
VAELGALVYLETGDEEALLWAIRIYEWVRAVLLGPDGLYFDRIDPVGGLNTDVWSYNQGTMIGAGVLLHRITGEQNYLTHASVTAAASMTHFPTEALVGRDAAFHAVFFRNLFMLDQVVPDSSYRQRALTYGNHMWEQFRNVSTGLFNGNMSRLNNSAPLVETYALLAGAPPHP